MIDLDGPFRKRPRLDPDRVFMVITLIICAAFAILVAFGLVKTFFGHSDNGRVRIKRSELYRIQRYHGTKALKILGEKVWIWRDGKWLRVASKI